MPYLSLRIFRTGTIALVVHDAAEIILSASVKDLSLTPKPQDRVNFEDSDYEVTKVERDPVTALYKLHIRER